MCPPPPTESKFFQFHAAFRKIWQNCMLAPPPQGNPWSATGFQRLIVSIILRGSCIPEYNWELDPVDPVVCADVSINARFICCKLQDSKSGVHMVFGWSLLGSYLCFITTSLDTVDTDLLLRLCTTCQVPTLMLDLEVEPCTILYNEWISSCGKYHWLFDSGSLLVAFSWPSVGLLAPMQPTAWTVLI